MWPFRRKKAVLPPDNYGKTCHPLMERPDATGASMDASCSLCGARLSLWPHRDERCSSCGAKVVDE